MGLRRMKVKKVSIWSRSTLPMQLASDKHRRQAHGVRNHEHMESREPLSRRKLATSLDMAMTRRGILVRRYAPMLSSKPGRRSRRLKLRLVPPP